MSMLIAGKRRRSALKGLRVPADDLRPPQMHLNFLTNPTNKLGGCRFSYPWETLIDHHDNLN